MSEATVHILYAGKAVDDGTMDVRDLAPALLGMGDLCQNANRVLNGEDVSASVRVRADFEKGSFEITLHLIQSLLDHVKNTLYGRENVSAIDVLTFLGFMGISVPGVIQFLQWLKGEKPKNVTVLENGQIRIENVHHSHIVIAPQVSQLANSSIVRDALPEVLEPLTRPGIDSLQTRIKRRKVVVVKKEDLPYLQADVVPPEPEPPLLDITTDAVLQVVRPSFEDRLKWTLTDGKNSYTIDVNDSRFKAQVESGELNFAAHDALRVQMRTRTHRTIRGGITTEHEITQVKEVIRGPRTHRQTLLLGKTSDDGEDGEET